MRSCPTCSRIFPSSKDYSFCRFDGTNLLTEGELGESPTLQKHEDDPTTLKIPLKDVRNPSALKAAMELSEEKELNALRKVLNYSEEGVRYAHAAVESLLVHLQQQVEEITEFAHGLNIQYLKVGIRESAIVDDQYGVKISWRQVFSNTLDNSGLSIIEYRRGGPHSTDKEFQVLEFGFNLSPDFQPVWKEQDESRVFTPEQLAKECMECLVHLIRTKGRQATQQESDED